MTFFDHWKLIIDNSRLGAGKYFIFILFLSGTLYFPYIRSFPRPP